jgi:hypothetical protein
MAMVCGRTSMNIEKAGLSSEKKNPETFVSRLLRK